MTRRYAQTRRAESQAQTRRRIVEATIRLHETVGAAATTITAIAEQAGVSRLTIYRHFPDQLSLLQACTGTYDLEHPTPDLSALAGVRDPEKRLRLALAGLYAYFSENEAILSHGADSLPTVPELGVALRPRFEGIRRLAELLATGWKVEAGPGTALAGAIGHAVSLPTWRSLRQQQGLTNNQSVELMVGMVLAVARSAATPKP